MIEVVGVRFKPTGRIYFYSKNETLDLEYNQPVIVESQKAKELAYVAIPNKEMKKEDLPEELKPIIQVATSKQLVKQQKNDQDAKDAFTIAKSKILEHQLEMKLVDVEYTFDRSKMVFSFTADGRIDFRNLVKDLASIFKTRIELRQIGVRDEAKLLGGIGPCGRPLCCSTFLGDFAAVSIKMAKEQNLSLNPTKISGVCGRLMCCLNYENSEYERLREKMPDFGEIIETPDGKGKVIGLNILSEVIKVKLFQKETPMEYDLDELLELELAEIKED
ncbi:MULTISPECIES: stage 0 sporulation family protein [Vagococcus]|uniref:Signal peptidase-like protein n=1 Tax=Vagococcus fluvialis bH819 TaxID=1255619 RepID=A0A1X6WQA4_9ENTE|nr:MULTISPECIES: stage 0 sporulation family protein [Vagococcus]SLM86484.1 Signal peptidase-like protein [Vagococcus fluvialis bH819]HCM90692.1 signal peptidase [Vagococcus sp.]